ncbi:MAG: hypothetical protein QW061_02180 [Candidatus Rehaiarchaeum fermentans]|nr:hypothetical protein [Candidatus Rehaiarchaeum fermentans]
MSKKEISLEIILSIIAIIAIIFIFNQVLKRITTNAFENSSLIIASVSQSYLVTYFYVFLGIIGSVGVFALIFGIFSVLALYKHKNDNAPIFILTLNLNKNQNPLYLFLISAFLGIISTILLIISVFSNYYFLFFISILFGVIAFSISSALTTFLCAKYVIRFLFRYTESI